VRKELQTFIGANSSKQGYTEVFTPHIGRLELYKTSGHFPYYKESAVRADHRAPGARRTEQVGLHLRRDDEPRRGRVGRLAAGINERTKAQTIAPDRVMADDKLIDGFMLKPMNCPHHAKIFASAPHSPTATCPCASPSSARCIAGSSRAN
jgi:threonyl-tRNA synthetase